MTFFLQHGFGKGNKIDLLATDNRLDGIVLSPADEDTNSLQATAATVRGHGGSVLLDPQTYVYSNQPVGTARNHATNGIAFGSLTWSQDARESQRQVEAVGRLNGVVNPNGAWIAPSVLQSGFADVWTPLAIQLARTASDSWGAERTIASVVLDESALATAGAAEDWLDVVTTLDVRGFYILVQRPSVKYPPQPWASERLSRLLSVIYSLSVLNGYEVHWGYSDSEGLLGLAAGAIAVSTGWSFGLRQFSTLKWVPAGGGKPAIIRVPLAPLWASVRASGEAEDLYASRLRASVFPPSILGRFPRGEFGSFTRTEAQTLYLHAIAGAARSISAVPTIPDRLDLVELRLREASDLHRRIADAGITLESSYRTRVSVMGDALADFRRREGV
jgi:hypothetical protein